MKKDSRVKFALTIAFLQTGLYKKIVDELNLPVVHVMELSCYKRLAKIP